MNDDTTEIMVAELEQAAGGLLRMIKQQLDEAKVAIQAGNLDGYRYALGRAQKLGEAYAVFQGELSLYPVLIYRRADGVQIR